MRGRAPRILVAVSGSISAYKAAEIVRLLMKAGARVDVAMTPSAQRFITPLTFGAITQRRVLVDLWAEGTGEIDHVEKAHDVDLMLIAPASANVLARLAHGMADDIVTATALATTAPILVAPAMETGMWENAATQDNLQTLAARGVGIIPPEAGPLASGRQGLGRLAAPETVVAAVLERLETQEKKDFSARRLVITAGPTYEPLDPVRVLTNRSTGEMGIALAAAAAARGAQVSLILGPTHLAPPAGVQTVRVETALEMLEAAERATAGADVFIAAAAVSDFRPETPQVEKLKRSDPRAQALALVENPDVLATLAPRLKPRGLVVGFAAETEAVEENGKKKLQKKGCDLLIANRVGKDRGFGPGETEVLAIRPDTPTVPFGPAPKAAVASFILDQIAALLPA
ncbi:MAG: bifunctional phosphopantothenoylcysteine decarboxylase/phosphopantothenate--cysteine ligase CoaBC [Myxococcota bacterium]